MPDVTLTFRLDEDVTPDLFARRVTQACANEGALRPGEGVLQPSDPTQLLRVTDVVVQTADLPWTT